MLAQRLNIHSYTPEEGLAGAPVWRIFQDERGVMWFATEGGVSAYDGVSFQSITVENGLPSASVELIARARDGSLWFGTRTGLVRYDGTSLRQISRDEGRWAGSLDALGNAWSGDIRGIFVFDGRSTKLFDASAGLAGEEVYSVTPIDGSVWIGRRTSGVVEMLVHGTQLDGVRRYGPSEGLAHPTVRALVRDRDGRMYFGTRGGGISRFDGKSFVTFDKRNGLPSNDVYAMLITRRGELVVGTIDNGLAICDLPDFHRCRAISVGNGLHSRSVFSLFEDREGNLWVGLVNGVSKLMSLHAESFTEQTRGAQPADERLIDLEDVHMSLANSLGMRVVAEGVETAEQLTHLRARGCEFGQGYYFSHPLDADSATKLILSEPSWAAPPVM